jgi:glycosyltransferase involved in cell wall biosynthesis
MHPLNDIVIIALNDFDTLWYQRQALAVLFAKAGHKVFYFNKTPQRWPKPAQTAKWLFKRTKNLRQSHLPENLKIVNPFWLVPAKTLKPINRKLVRQTIEKLDIKNAIVITDVPSYNTLDAIEQIRPEKTVYINIHNYDDSDRIISNLLESEKILIQQADFLFATSEHNTGRIARISNGRELFRSLPGVDFELFAKAFRGNEAQRAKTIYFFGMIHDMVDTELYNQLSKQFKVVFIGETIGGITKAISEKIEIRPAVSQKELAEQLTEADIIGLFYRQNAYTKGVIPAKIFECLAAGKPVLVSGLEKDPVYSQHVYHFDGTEQAAVEIIKNLQQTETQEKIKNGQAAAKQADWQKRFESFRNIMLSESKGLPKFSVLMSVYGKDRPDYFRGAIDSILNQTARPDEIVLVKDGPVDTELDSTINKYQKQLGGLLKIVSLQENKGLGAALAEGIKNCTFDIVARMDADDISVPQRFEKQLRFLKNNPNIDVVSCFVAAFEQNPEKILFIRRGPALHEQIAKKFRFRFCMNHAASMFRKAAVLDAGNYPAFAGLEDYHLWARMILNGTKMATICQILYLHRWQKQLLKRRSGAKRAAQQIKLQREFLKIGFINRLQFLRNLLVRSTAAILPQSLTKKIRIVLGI